MPWAAASRCLPHAGSSPMAAACLARTLRCPARFRPSPSAGCGTKERIFRHSPIWSRRCRSWLRASRSCRLQRLALKPASPAAAEALCRRSASWMRSSSSRCSAAAASTLRLPSTSLLDWLLWRPLSAAARCWPTTSRLCARSGVMPLCTSTTATLCFGSCRICNPLPGCCKRHRVNPWPGPRSSLRNAWRPAIWPDTRICSVSTTRLPRLRA